MLRWVTWCFEKLRLVTRLSPAASWPRTGKALTESSTLSETGLIRWQQWRGECCRELGTSQTCRSFTHNISVKRPDLY
ncbi:hypothetical protein B296_00052645 [Ensete ventricosum]|uniref:Uncharacterized protein n=1 Tax=Ensete ventricosum TaxID=4639 RepID=A0A426WVV0_ENSVE|nr:hypothetical protein B296_00052645 [Ensete ventricosum]